MKTLTCSAALLAAALLAACGESGGTPAQASPGVLTVSLAAPVAGDRALVIAITGPGQVSEVQPAVPGYTAFARTQGTGARVAVMGAIAAGPVLRITVPDVRQAKQYQAAVVDAADGGNTARASMAAYSLTVSR
ncbi:MAG TPA: hypothetical protein VEX86_10405 [Longimicrobium sp.]|nr:hypothetical protein [Longimicrobium sp.]